MKLAIGALLVIVGVLGWFLIAMNKSLETQRQSIKSLEITQADNAKQQALALQIQCAEQAAKDLASRGWTSREGQDYQTHYSARHNKCFVLTSGYIINSDFITYDLYDAVEGRRYATYNGHNICDVAITEPRKCALDGGSIWFDGNDHKMPPDFAVGFRGLLYGGGAGDEKTKQAFLDAIQQFMAE